jgi:hypothetical protein
VAEFLDYKDTRHAIGNNIIDKNKFSIEDFFSGDFEGEKINSPHYLIRLNYF